MSSTTPCEYAEPLPADTIDDIYDSATSSPQDVGNTGNVKNPCIQTVQYKYYANKFNYTWGNNVIQVLSRAKSGFVNYYQKYIRIFSSIIHKP